VEDYAEAWSAERGRCHRLVYDSDGKPDNCPEPPVAVGWRRDGRGRWFAVDACAGHASELVKRPRPSAEVERTAMVECLNCGQPFDPTRYRWRCPTCGMKDTCCEGQPCPLPVPARDPAEALKPVDRTPSLTRYDGS
jgi:hypothetical protein